MNSMKSGFTLIELLVTLSIAAILLAVAVPNFIVFVQNNRLASQANEVVTLLNFARSESIRRGIRTTVCSSADSASCAGSTTWDTGLIVFADTDGDGAVDIGENVLQVKQAMEGGNTLRTAARVRITFQSNGFSTGFADTYRLCDTRGTASGRALVVSNQGRVRVATLAAEGLTCP